MKRVLVLTEKHGTHIFDASTDKLLAQAALRVLIERFNEGCWYIKPEAPKPPDFEEASIEFMPPSMRAAAKMTIVQYKDSHDRYLGELDDYRRIERAIDTRDGWLAWCVLRDRSDYEYERAELEDLADAGDIEVKWPPVPLSTPVVTTKSKTLRGHVPESELGQRQWGVAGVIVGFTDTHGLRYTVQHTSDGTYGSYSTPELKLQPRTTL